MCHAPILSRCRIKHIWEQPGMGCGVPCRAHEHIAVIREGQAGDSLQDLTKYEPGA